MVAAIQNGAIERFNILKQFAGFADAPTEIECFSTNRATTKESNVAVIDFGASSTKMYLSHNGVLNRMHRVNVGGATLTAALASDQSLSFEAAETIKLQPEHSTEHYELLKTLYAKHYRRSLREFKQVYDDHVRSSGVSFDRIMICGGASVFPEVQTLVTEAFDLEVTSINPFDSVAYPAFMEDVMRVIGAGFVPSLGAALRIFE